MTAPRLVLIFLVAFLLMLVALTPLSAALSWAAPRGALTASKVEGSVWGGRMTGASLGGLPLGSVRGRLEVLPLLTGAARLDIEARGGVFTGKGRLLGGGRRRGADRITGVVALEQLGFGGATAGALKLTDVTALFDRGRCLRAAGKASAQIGGTGPIAQPVVLAGTPACIQGRWVLSLAGEAQGLRIEAAFSLSADGAWRSELILIPTDPALGQVLTASGFTQDGDRWRRVLEGRP